MTTRPYATPAAFKQALETRLKNASSTGLDFGRRRQVLVFERFLARIAPLFGDGATLKGGLALELRLERARTTKDVDLRVAGSPARILDRLQEAGRLDVGDFMAFEVHRVGPCAHAPPSPIDPVAEERYPLMQCSPTAQQPRSAKAASSL